MAFLLAASSAGLAQIAGRSVNMVSGTELPFGDPFLQRQNEPSVAVSTRNPQHLLAGANDYRTVDLPGLPEGKVTGDAWLGVFKSFDGGESWISTLIPGFPQDDSAEGQASPLKGFEAAADPVVRAGTNGLFYYSGIAFDRGDNSPSSVFVSLFIDNNNKENGDPIKFVRTRIVDQSPGAVFIDKPWMAVDVPRAGAETANIEVPKDEDPGDTVVQSVRCGNVYVAWAEFTGSEGGGELKSRIMLSRSTDCGDSWSAPIQLNRPGPGASAVAAVGSRRAPMARPPAPGSEGVSGPLSRASGRASSLTGLLAAVNDESFDEEIEAIDELIEQVKEKAEKAGLNEGETNSLIKKLENAKKSLERDNPDAAIGQLEAFINEMEALVESGRLSAEDAQECIDKAQEIIDSIRAKSGDGDDDDDDDDGDEDDGDGKGEELFAEELDAIEQLVEDVEQTADAAGLSEEDEEALIDQLEAAEESLEKNDPEGAVDALNGFVDGLDQLVAEGALTEEQAEPLATSAFEIASSIEVKSLAGTEQGTSIAIDPNDGTVYVAWRRFGSPDEPHAMLVTRSTDGGRTFGNPVTVAEIDPFEQGTSEISFRTNDFPSLAVDGDGTVYAAFSERIGPEGDARVVVATSSDGQSWSAPGPVDDHPDRGHQFMPSLTFAAGKLTVVYYDQREDVSGRFESFIHDSVFPRHTVDLRVAQADPGPSPAFAPSERVSRNLHVLEDPDADSGDIEQVEFNPPNFPMFREGTVPFFSDYIDVAPAPAFVADGSGNWSVNTDADKTLVFHTTWADNRDVREPLDGDWTNYTPPTSDQDPAFATSVDCIPGQTGMRNQNVYTSRISQGVRIGVPGNTKPLNIQRAFIVFAENTTADVLHVRMRILDQPPGGEASFLQFDLLTEIDISIPAHSLASRTVFVRSSDDSAVIRVQVVEISGPGGGETGGFDGTVVINPDPTNPNVVNPNVVNPNVVNPNVVNAEVYNATFVNPNVVNPNVVNPNVVNPNVVNLSFVNPNVVNPNVVNPNVVNPNVVNPNVVNPNVVNSSLEEAQWAVRNDGNTSASYSFKMLSGQDVPEGIEVQLLITRVHRNPVAIDCSLEERLSQELLANIINPNIINPNTEPFDPSATNLEDPSIENATFFLAPGDVVLISLRIFDPDATDDIGFDPQSVGAAITPHAVNTEEAADGAIEPTASVNLTITSSSSSLPPATVDSPFSATLEALGGVEPLSWNVIDGALPDGLTLDAATGEISGTPTATGTFDFTVEVTDSSSPERTDIQTLRLEAAEAVGPTITELKQVASDAAAGDAFGNSVSVFGNTAVVGAVWDDDAGTDSGSAYVLRRQSDGSWAEVAKLIASDAAAEDLFGLSVSISGDTAVIGAADDDHAGTDSGSAYVFRRQSDGSWSEEAKLTASDGAPGDSFGRFVSASGNIAVVGAVLDDDAGTGSGSAYVFLRQSDGSWTEEAKLSASDAAAGDFFGRSVSASGNTAIVGAVLGDDTDSGSAYVFRRNGDGSWTEEAKLTASDAAADDRFGISVSVFGDTAVAGAPQDDDAGTDSGSAYVFRKQSDGSWTEEAKLTASDAAAGDRFGWSVSASEDTAIVGALLGDDTDSGSAYVFRRNGDGSWAEVARLTASDAAAEDWFGFSASVSGDTTLLGAPLDDTDAGTDSGSVYFFELTFGSLSIDTTSLPDATVGSPYSETLQASGGTGTLSWSIVAGALPDGLALDASTGEIAGTPSASGNFAFTVEVTDSGNPQQTDARDLFITVEPSGATSTPSITTTSLPGGVVGTTYSEALEATGGTTPYTWSVITGTLPDGLTLDADTGEISGTPTAIGTFDFTGEVTDSSSPARTDRQTLSIHVAELKEVASDGAAGDDFGFSVSVFGDAAVVGARSDDDAGTDSGSAYVFRQQSDGTWAEEFKLTASDAAAGDQFGWSVAVSGDTAITGARPAAVAYAFRRLTDGSWDQEAKLIASEEAGAFGTSVAVSGDTAVIGAPRHDWVAGDNAGSAWVFRRQDDGTWEEETRLTASDAGALDRFGFSVSLSGDTAVIGAAPMDDEDRPNSGAAYVLRRNADGTWVEEAKLTGSDAVAGDRFGLSVSVSGDTAVVGAQADLNTGNEAAYVFRRQADGTWVEEFKLTASDGRAGDLFGRSVAVSGDTAVVGSPADADAFSDSGSAYVFRRQSDGSWVEERKFIASDTATGDLFGWSVAVSGKWTAVGALNDDDAGTDSGSVYFFELTFGSLSIDTMSLPDGTVGTSYSATLEASGGTGSLSWSVVAGALPDGLDLNASTGEIAGTPSTSGNFAFTVQVADSSTPQQTDTRDLAITVEPSGGTSSLSITTTSVPDGFVDEFYSAALSATGGTEPFTWSLASGSGPLPDGLEIDPAGEIVGTPTTDGTFDFTVEVTDSGSPQQSDTQDLSITVGASSVEELAFSVQPTKTPVGGVIDPAVEVTATDSADAALPGITVSLSLAPHPGGGALTGTVVATTDAEGTATFSDLSIDAAGEGYVLKVSTQSGSATATSVAFDVFREGGVLAWGSNSDGQLGDGTTTDRSTPTRAVELSDASAIVAGLRHTVALVADRTLRAWGENDVGQLGDGTTTSSATPVQVSGLSDVIAVSGRHRNGVALKSDGTVWGWGSNDFGQLGDGTKTDRLTPVQVSGFADGRAIAGGNRHSLALRSDATLWAWGSNGFGQLGIGADTVESLTPTQVTGLVDVVTIGVGSHHSLAVTSDGTAWSWGRNDFGQLGDGTTTNRFTPVQVIGLSDVIAVAAGFDHSLALRSDGTVWAWGRNNFGQLGDGTQADNSTPVQVQDLSGIGAIAAGNAHSLALKADGTAWAWGSNAQGRLGDGTEAARSIPVQVNGLDRGLAIAGGGAHSVAATSTLAITTTSLPGGEVDSSYNATLQAVGGIGDRSWSVVTGSLPDGLSLDSSTGEISGTPSTDGTFDFTVEVKDSGSPQQSDTQDLSITVNPGSGTSTLSITTTSLPGGVVGAPYSETLEATGGTTPYTWSIITGTLPDGLTLDSATGEISGEPTSAAEGTSDFTVEVTDSSSPQQSDTQDLSITVEQPVLSFPAQPSNGLAGETFSFEVKVEDGSGDPVEGVTVALSLGENLTGGTLSGTTSVDSDASGIAAFTDLSLDFGGIYSLVAAANPSIESDTFQVEGFFPAGDMSVPRATHAAGRLGDGRGVVTGGESGSTTTASVDLFEPATGLFSASFTDMEEARAEHTISIFSVGTDERILLVGGVGGAGTTGTAELHDSTGALIEVMPLQDDRNQHTATLLADGILVAGGLNSSFARFDAPSTNGSAEVYDLDTRTFSLVSDMVEPRAFHTATFLTDGTVLIVGGRTVSDGSSIEVTETAEIFDPVDGTFTATDSMSVPREEHAAVRLDDGRVLIAGGIDWVGGSPVIQSTAEIYDPATGTFSTPIDMVRGRSALTATLLTTEEILLAGGGTETAEIFDPVVESFRETASMQDQRERHTATSFVHPGLDGAFDTSDDLRLVLIAGGQDFNLPFPDEELDSAEVFFPIQ